MKAMTSGYGVGPNSIAPPYSFQTSTIRRSSPAASASSRARSKASTRSAHSVEWSARRNQARRCRGAIARVARRVRSPVGRSRAGLQSSTPTDRRQGTPALDLCPQLVALVARRTGLGDRLREQALGGGQVTAFHAVPDQDPATGRGAPPAPTRRSAVARSNRPMAAFASPRALARLPAMPRARPARSARSSVAASAGAELTPIGAWQPRGGSRRPQTHRRDETAVGPRASLRTPRAALPASDFDIAS